MNEQTHSASERPDEAAASSVEVPAKSHYSAEANYSAEEALTRRRFLMGAAATAGAVLVMRGNSVWSGLGAESASAATATVGSQGGTAAPATGSNAATALANVSGFANRAPLAATPYHALPLGSIEARGWLLKQLELQRDGLTGAAEDVLPATHADSAWLGGKGENWEKGPYYVKGLIALAYTLDDPALKAKAQKWVEGILKSQRADGFFGPDNNDDWWPRMVATYLLRDYAEATNDQRPIALLTNYYRYMAANMPQRPLRDWGRARAGDEIDTVLWLYNRTGDAFLLNVADLLHQQAYPWRDIMTNNRFLEFGNDFHPKHNVNVPQALKMPAVYSQRSKDAADRTAFYKGEANLMRDHGLAVGIQSGTEFLAGRSTTEGIELCSIVEKMLSVETAIRIFGDATLGDNLEMVAFNGLPAGLSKTIHQHTYYTLPNNVSAVRGEQGYLQDYGNGRSPSVTSGFPCCCYNFHMGWPKLAQNSWAATRTGGLAVMAYVPSRVTAKVLGGKQVTLDQETNYPFEEEIRLTVSTSQPTRFPLSLRVPGWCRNAMIRVNGKAQPAPKAGTFAVVDRTWQNGDKVTLSFPMTVQTVTGINDSVSVQRGPLLYSLQIGEQWNAYERGPREGFEAYEVKATTDWNYGLVLNPANPASSFKVQKKALTPGANPFEPKNVPVSLQTQAKKVPAWTMSYNGVVALDPPVSPVASTSPTETVTLVPFGSQMLRVANFPVIGNARPLARAYQDNFASGHADGWILYGGGWFVRDGAFHPASHRGDGQAVNPSARFANFVAEGNVIVGGSGDAGLTVRVNDAGIGSDSYKGYYIGIDAGRDMVTLGKADGKWTKLKEAPKTLAPDTPHLVRVEARGPQLRVWVDDMTQPLLEFEDATYTQGAIGVRHWGSNGDKPAVAFSNLKVTAL